MKIDVNTKLFGIIGYPLGHSFSPAMHNAAFEAAGVNAAYLAFPMKSILNLKYSMKQLGIRGLSVTIPYKINIRRSLDQIDPLALQIGSINTVTIDSAGVASGFNTDGPGAVESIEKSGFQIEGKKVLVIGSGGSARAIVFSLLQKNPALIGVAGRNFHSARSIVRGVKVQRKRPELEILFMPDGKRKAARIRHKYEHTLEEPGQLEKYDLIIQTTPMGMKGHETAAQSPLTKEFLSSSQVLFDIVYNPQVTPLVKLAKAKKMEIIPGYKMLLYQGTRQFTIFTGQEAPEDVMEKALLQELRPQAEKENR